MRFQGESAPVPTPPSPQDSGGESDIDQADNEVGREAVDAAVNFCKHCGGPTDDRGQAAVPPYQLSKFSPQDRGMGTLANNAIGFAGRRAENIADASRAKAASD